MRSPGKGGAPHGVEERSRGTLSEPQGGGLGEGSL